ncbi:hypothetical protein AB0L57_03580 [Nocardia sp. NPDC052254]|uniref:hypothetical protein n=1 Tax=Nocardia sp. NPDC052254 TaxID=3155681 RepID=UPI00344A08F7
MTSTRAFFSFPEITDPGRHAEYNEWHMLDHRPENLALQGVVHGDRWVLSPDCAAVGTRADPLLRDFHYMAMYWFAEPADDSEREWKALGRSTLEQGRRPELSWTRRSVTGFFRPVRGRMSDRSQISLAALPFRPTRGVYVRICELRDPASAATGTLDRWYDRVRVPQLLEAAGAVGGWTFRSERLQLAGARPDRLPHWRLQLIHLDEDPLDYVADLAERDRAREDPVDSSELESVVFEGPLRSIVPWQWNWFDEPAPTTTH